MQDSNYSGRNPTKRSCKPCYNLDKFMQRQTAGYDAKTTKKQKTKKQKTQKGKKKTSEEDAEGEEVDKDDIPPAVQEILDTRGRWTR